MIQAADMNSHMKLEFAKMTIRTKAIEIRMRLSKKRIMRSGILIIK
jgi:hypothetical protein